MQTFIESLTNPAPLWLVLAFALALLAVIALSIWLEGSAPKKRRTERLRPRPMKQSDAYDITPRQRGGSRRPRASGVVRDGVGQQIDMIA
jgi:uncharacterized protein (DUF58 family)